jgi:hypothetical protein
MKMKKDYIYRILDDYWIADFYVVVEKIVENHTYPVRTKFLFGEGSKPFGDAWELEMGSNIIEIGPIEDYPEYFI